MDREVPGLRRITMAFNAYPPNNVLKRLVIKAYFGWRVDGLADRQEVTDGMVDLAKAFSTSVDFRPRFPCLQSLDLIPVVMSSEPRYNAQDECNLQRLEVYMKDWEHIKIVLDGINLPFTFNVAKPRFSIGRLGGWLEAGLDRDDSRWSGCAHDNILVLQGKSCKNN